VRTPLLPSCSTRGLLMPMSSTAPAVVTKSESGRRWPPPTPTAKAPPKPRGLGATWRVDDSAALTGLTGLWHQLVSDNSVDCSLHRHLPGAVREQFEAARGGAVA
jgi:hypothetical protein